MRTCVFRSCRAACTPLILGLIGVAAGCSPQDSARLSPDLPSFELSSARDTDAALQQALQSFDGSVAQQLNLGDAPRAIGVLDLSDLRLAMIAPDEIFYGASVPKICIALAYFEKHPDAAERLDPRVLDELQRMIKRSDNDLAAKYSTLIGLDFIQEMLQSPRYALYDAQRGGLWCGKHYGQDQPRRGDPLRDLSHAASVRQCLRYYLLLEQNRLGGKRVCDRLRQVFAAPYLDFHDDGFVRGLKDRDVAMLRKNGVWEDWHLDTARIEHGQRVYLLAGMIRHARGDDYLARMAGRIDEQLCGAQPMKPYAHHLILHDASSGFGGADVHAGRPDAAGISLDLSGADSTLPAITSPEIATPFKFNEALLSWNVHVPAGAAIGAELRVGRSADNFWSEWLHIGEWGAWPEAWPRVTQFDGGKVDIDYFRSAERYDRVQYRLRAAGKAQSGPLRIERVALCVSDTSGMPDAFRRKTSRRDPPERAKFVRRLPVPFRSQKTERPELAGRICSPTSVAMVLAYRGVEQPTGKVAQTCYDARHDIYGNWTRAVQGAYALGVPGYLARFADWTDVEHSIADGQPLIISIRVPKVGDLRNAPYPTTDGHLIVLCGFDEDGNALVNDPAVSTPQLGQLVYRREDLQNVWMRETGGLAYVLLRAASPRE